MGSLFATKARIATWVLLLIIVVFGFSKLKLDGNIFRLLPAHMTEVQGLSMQLEHFVKPDELIVVVRGTDPDVVDEATMSLANFYRGFPDVIGEVVDHEPWEDSAEGMAELIAYSLLSKSPEDLGTFKEGLKPEKSKQKLQDTLSEMTFAFSPAEAWMSGFDAFGFVDFAMGDSAMGMMESSAFSNEDGTMRVLYLRLGGTNERGDYEGGQAKVARMRELREEWKNAHTDLDVKINYTGESVFAADISKGMENDMRSSAKFTLLIVGLIFLLWYRQILSLLGLIGMLALIFLLTLGLGGFLVGAITAMNVGFASILIGLCVDYGILIYQGTIRHPGSADMVRRDNFRGIVWAGATTAVAFGSLMASSLPGISELGLLVGVGIGVGALVMLIVYAALMETISKAWAKREEPIRLPAPWILSRSVAPKIGYAVLLLIVAAGIVLVMKGVPGMDGTNGQMRPRVSEAHDTMEVLAREILGSENSGNIIVRSDDAKELAERLETVEGELQKLEGEGDVLGYTMPTAFVPSLENQQANLKNAAAKLMADADRFDRELSDAGFSEEAGGLQRGIFGFWKQWQENETKELILPQSEAARWMLDRLVQVTDEGAILTSVTVTAKEGTNLREIQTEGVFLADWSQAMLALRTEIPSEVLRILLVLGCVVLVMLWFAFRRVQDVLWVLLTISHSVILVLGAMSLLGWTWNFFNMAALLLVLGAGLDYSIHMVLGFRREGDVGRVQRDIGQALLVCALSTVAGFATLGAASFKALASLGQVCALALFLNALVAIFLLPLLWGHSQQLLASRNK